MPLRLLLRFLNNQQVVEQLANTSIIRRFAQLTHYTYIRATVWGNQVLNKMAESTVKEPDQENQKDSGRLASFSRTFMENIQKEIEASQKGKKNPYD
ncbi:uncharacterized protein LOC116290060 [Actinia tenebrosa]|uniref:Uncharacterized protein LOC116290060 n=1 Tax=Actinia tenebrosa TaxID=6105 RepID=A0A6P8HJP0_ACTTE|nr:uncharacterized protein LOC116290060 [Actinia tenebrosa]